MKMYHGEMENEGMGEQHVFVTEDKKEREIMPSRKYNSGGFGWGFGRDYSGTGARETAYSILTDMLGDQFTAGGYAEDFIHEFVRSWGRSFVITDAAIGDWIKWKDENRGKRLFTVKGKDKERVKIHACEWQDSVLTVFTLDGNAYEERYQYPFGNIAYLIDCCPACGRPLSDRAVRRMEVPDPPKPPKKGKK